MPVMFEVKSCQSCPNASKERYYTADSFETETEYKCKAKGNKRIGIYDWVEENHPEKMSIPQWCPLREKAK